MAADFEDWFKIARDFLEKWKKDRQQNLIPMSSWLTEISNDTAKMRIDGTAPEDYRWPGK
jgi:hypothetical protein